MADLIARYGQMKHPSQSPFQALMRAIVAQQISTKAANAIRARIELEIGTNARDFSHVNLERLRSLGLPRRKAASLLAASSPGMAGRLSNLVRIRDHEARSQLLKLPGVGPWTAEMVLIFGLGRQDVWPLGDAGLITSARITYGATGEQKFEELGDRFRPFRSWAARYLWKSLENT